MIRTAESILLMCLAEACDEARVGEGVLDLLALLLCRDAKAREVLRGLQGCVLGKVHDVERGLPCLNTLPQ